MYRKCAITFEEANVIRKCTILVYEEWIRMPSQKMKTLFTIVHASEQKLPSARTQTHGSFYGKGPTNV